MKTTLTIILSFIILSASAQDGPSVGLVLSGGGAKGFAHVAVLKEIEKAGIELDYIAGTSMGAIIGGLYASGYSADELERIIYNTDFNTLIFGKGKNRKSLPLFDKTYNERYIIEVPISNFKIKIPSAISKGNNAFLFLSQLLNNQHNTLIFNELPIPFLCVATDLETGEEKIFESGFLPKAIMASAALPSLIKPVEINGRKYIDGGLVNNFPAELLKKKGLDIIIGVNLGQGLKDLENINGIKDVLEQISNFSIIKGVENQFKYIDVLINPDLKNYSVTSFSDKDSIIKIGKKTANLYTSVFDSINNLQKQKQKQKQKIIIKDTFLIKNIILNGKDKFNSNYVLGKLNLEENTNITSEEITKGIKSIYSSNNYSNIDYQLVNKNPYYDLSVDLTEDANKTLFKFGLHYDDVFKTSALLNFTLKHFVFNNTSLSMDFILGDNSRYYIKLFSDNGITPSLGFNSSYYKIPIKLNPYDVLINYLNYDFLWFNNSVYVQSTLKDKYAVGLVLNHDYTEITNSSLSTINPNKKIENSYYISPAFFVSIDTRNNPNYPTNGLKLYTEAKYLWQSNQFDFRPSIHFNGYIENSFKVYKNLTSTINVSFGTSIDNNSSVFNQYLGGINKQHLLYFDSFNGYDFASINNEHKIKLGITLQYTIFKNNYLQLIGNMANLEKEFKDLSLLKYDYTGVGVNYGYDSPLGPIQFYYSYSPQIKDHIFNFSLGYWF